MISDFMKLYLVYIWNILVKTQMQKYTGNIKSV